MYFFEKNIVGTANHVTTSTVKISEENDGWTYRLLVRPDIKFNNLSRVSDVATKRYSTATDSDVVIAAL